jgi:hypothetical protein
MKKLTLLFVLMGLMGLNVSCSDREAELDDIQREESPINEAGEELEHVGDDIEDSVD